jgi:hypothetical protein
MVASPEAGRRLGSSHLPGCGFGMVASLEGWQEIRFLAPPGCGFGMVASPEGWQEFSPGWSASDTRGFSFNANRTPEGCEDNLG